MPQQAFAEIFIGCIAGRTIPFGGLSQQLIEPLMLQLHESVELSATRASNMGFAIFYLHRLRYAFIDRRNQQNDAFLEGLQLVLNLAIKRGNVS